MSEERKRQNRKKKGILAEIVSGMMTSKKMRTVIAVAAVIVVLFLGFAVYAASYDNIFPGVTVNGVEVGGLSLDEATEIIRSEIAEPLENKSLVLKCGENDRDVTVTELSPDGIDAQTIAQQAYDVGRSGGFVSKAVSFLSSVFGAEDINASIDFDNEILKTIVDEISAEYSTDVVETGYTLEGNTLTITKGSGGRRVDMEKAEKLVGEALADSEISEVVFEVEDAEPKPVSVDEFYADLTKPAQDAVYKLEDGQITVVDEVYGIIVDKDDVEKALESGQDSVKLTVETVKPSKSASELKSLLFRDVMGEFSSNYASSSSARANNVELAAKRINGRILMPGDVFSYDQAIGERTAANGYQSAGVYVGNKVESGIGGGICQPSSTLYGAVLYANLEIVTRTSHSLPVSYVPAGQDATIAQGYIDFKFRNNTEYPVKIVATYGGRNLNCRILGVKPSGQTVELVHSLTGTLSPKVDIVEDEAIPEGYKKTVTKGTSGSTYSSRRIVRENGKEVKNEKLTNSVYNATNTEIRVNPADMETSPDALTEYTGQEIIEEENEGEAEGSEETADENGAENDANSSSEATGETTASTGSGSGAETNAASGMEISVPTSGQTETTNNGGSVTQSDVTVTEISSASSESL